MDQVSKLPAYFFVYGTLKRGQCREKCWPYKPQQVMRAWTLGRLFDLGDYPALLDGSDQVWGEVWEYRADEAEAVLAVLDEIEVTNQPGTTNLYDRILCTATVADSTQLAAYTYRFAHPIPQDQYIAPHPGDDKKQVAWPQDQL
ncbi:MAG: hypothetical protein Aurels2KO_37060 [Aureliella sp.]